jgi:dTDP-4-dehydrorhamnose reductase
MRIVVTGKKGQLAQSLMERAAAFDATVVTIGRPELDLADAGSPVALLAAEQPDLIVSAAAYTAVDKAESEPILAHAVNGDGPRALADAAAALGIPVIHISTDYVFDGSKPEPWTEEDTPAPVSVYGASKLAGEKAVLAASRGNVVVRIGWVYSPFGANFAKTILRLAGERDVLRIVSDQTGGPSSALDIADGVLTMARNVHADPDRTELRGLFHMAPQDTATWADLAEEICAWLAANRGRHVAVERITTADYPTAAQRPANSRLDSRRLAAVHGFRMPPWRASLPSVLERLI